MKASFATETELCSAFIAALPDGWVAYPETGGFDIVLLRSKDGFQIGVEAKLKLNAKVVCQAAESTSYWSVDSSGPDCRAVLVPDGVSTDFAGVCGLLGITVIRMRDGSDRYNKGFHPNLPDRDWRSGWYEQAPAKRIKLPDWVPDVSAGASSPIALTPWKVKAIKIAITMERRGYVTRGDFKFFQISMSRWTQGRWLAQDGKGGWIAGRHMPDFRAQHPVNYDQIAADFEKWNNPAADRSPVLETML